MKELIEQLRRYQDDDEVSEALRYAADAIEKLEAENAQLRREKECRDGYIAELNMKLDRVSREKEAAVADLIKSAYAMSRCIVCKHEHDGLCKHGGKCFEWRGVQEEKEDGKAD